MADNPCVWIDVINRNFGHGGAGYRDYIASVPCKDPTYLRNLRTTIDRLTSTGADVAIFHFEDFSSAVVYVADIPFNPALKKALGEARDYLQEMVKEALENEDPKTIKKFQEHLERVTRFKRGFDAGEPTGRVALHEVHPQTPSLLLK